MEKNLITLSKLIITKREWDFLDRELVDKSIIAHKRGVMMELVNQELSTSDMLRLYGEGITYKELGELYDRKFQSIARSLKGKLTDKIVKQHKENRKLWVRLMNKYYIVYLTDLSGGYQRLMDLYELDEKKARELYRRSGGEVLINRDKKEDETMDNKIKYLLDQGYTGIEISRIMEVPQATIYYRINNRVNGKNDK